MSSINQSSPIKEAWSSFINTGEVQNDDIRNLIADSWLRSKQAGVEPFDDRVFNELSSSQITKLTNAFRPVLDIANPFMKTLHDTVGDSGMIVRLTNYEGYVIECFSDELVIHKNSKLHLYKGSNVSEDVIGTNAIGLALKKGVAMQVRGAEHYRKSFHEWTTSAAPIRNEKGDLIAVISLSGKCESAHNHTLGMVMASALAIEHELKLNKSNIYLKRANEHLEAIMESINEGIITVDPKGLITDVNTFALRFLKKKYDELKGSNIENLITKNMVKQMLRNESFDESEMYLFINKNSKKSVIVNIIPIRNQKNITTEYLITFRESKRVYSQANKIFGSKAIYTFEDILGESDEIEEAIKLAKLVSNTDATILLHGESGTGKELFAQGIHNESGRKGNSFIFINCGAIPRDLVASELFGYEEGAFTGARKGGHPGKFELADGGTIFLDEIGDMPLDTQANLLRVLETKEVVRVGGHEVIPVDVRVIAATHKDLKKEVEIGNFRSDLYYRLNVMPIHTPALCERVGDIRILIDYFYLQFSKKRTKKIQISEEFYKAMAGYKWPGNVRELQNVMQMVTNLLKGNEKLGLDHLPKYMNESFKGDLVESSITVKPLAVLEKEAIIKALKISDNNLVKTAKLLDIGRSTLYRKIEKYGIVI